MSLEHRQPMEFDASFASLPVDIVVQIFRLCVPSFRERHHTARENAPFLLCSVCSSWRKLAMESPVLWSRPQLTLSATKEGGFALLETFMTRSAQSPFSLRIFNSTGSFHISSQTLSRFLSTVAPVVHRVQALDLAGVDIDHSLLALFREKWLGTDEAKGFCNLKVLSVAPKILDDTSPDPALRHFAIAAGLQSLTCDVGRGVNIYPFPVWDQLRYLSIIQYDVSPKALFHSLEACRSLVACRLRIGLDPAYHAPSSPGRPIVPDITLPSLRKLQLMLDPYEAHVLRHLHTPKLEEIEFHSVLISPDKEVIVGTAEYLPSFISRHTAYLRVLRLQLVSIPCAEFRHCLESARRLHTLKIDYIKASEVPDLGLTMVNALIWTKAMDASGVGPAPALTALVLMVHDEAPFGQVLLAAISSRRRSSATASIKSLHLIDGSPASSVSWFYVDELERLQMECTQGLRLKYTYEASYAWYNAVRWAWDVVDGF